MACEVEVMNSCDLQKAIPLAEEPNHEILSLKESLKDKLRSDNINGSINGNHEGDRSTSSNSSVSDNVTVENGIQEEIEIFNRDEHVVDVRRQTPKKTAKGKLGKTKKKITKKPRKQQTPVKKNDIPPEEESTQSEQSFHGTEPPNHDIEEDDTSTIDVVNDDDVEVNVDDDELDIDIDILSPGSIEMKEEICDQKPDDVKTESALYRWYNNMRLSVSPRKQTLVPSSIDVSSSTSFESKGRNLHSFRGISARRALHSNSSLFELGGEAEPAAFQTFKRKALSESPETPERKRFINSLTERSPGWKYFSSPFTLFWNKSADTTVSSSTPLRQLHEDVELADSMAVNIDDSMDNSLREDLEIGMEKAKLEKNSSKDEKSVDDGIVEAGESSWRCIIM